MRSGHAEMEWRTLVLPKSLGGLSLGFTPTGSIKTPVQERSKEKRAPLVWRLRYALFDCGVWFHGLILTTVIVGLTYRVSQIFKHHDEDLQDGRDWHETAIDLLRYVAWPNPAWLSVVLSCWIPLRYAIFPPDMPPRQVMMGNRDETGARYPLSVHKREKWSFWDSEYVPIYTAVSLSSAFLLLGSGWL
jgi:hypothetical protein